MKRIWLVFVIGLLSIGVFANPFTSNDNANWSTHEASVTVDFSSVGDQMIGFFNANWPIIVTLLAVSIGVPWALKMFRRLAR